MRAVAAVFGLFVLAMLTLGMCAGAATGGGGGPAPQPGAQIAGIPPVAMAAFELGQRHAAASWPGCGLTAAMLAGIDKVESNHSAGRTILEDGTVEPRILGPRLSPGSGFAVIPDTDDGLLDGDTEWDRAVGPMQFIPSSWAIFADLDGDGRADADGNRDGRSDPDNYFDVALAAAEHLCRGGHDMRTSQGFAAAVLSYNQSYDYLEQVRLAVEGYTADTGRAAAVVAGAPVFANGENGRLPDSALTIIGVDTSGRTARLATAVAPSWLAMADAARADGVELRVVDAYRSIWDQERLADELGIYGQGGWAAVPGTSNHGWGLAVDVDVSGDAYGWLTANAGRFGWWQPMSDETWHWEPRR